VLPALNARDAARTSSTFAAAEVISEVMLVSHLPGGSAPRAGKG
jgi:hypothetical protein